MKEILQNIGYAIFGLLFIFSILLILGLLFKGGIWLSAMLYPWLVGIFGITLSITVFVLLPNAVFTSTPRFAGYGMVLASYIFGVTLWVWSLLLTYVLWGGIALFIGLFLVGVGVVPIAMLATLFKGMWSTLGQLVLVTVMTFGTRIWGLYLLEKAERNTASADLNLRPLTFPDMESPAEAQGSETKDQGAGSTADRQDAEKGGSDGIR